MRHRPTGAEKSGQLDDGGQREHYQEQEERDYHQIVDQVICSVIKQSVQVTA